MVKPVKFNVGGGTTEAHFAVNTQEKAPMFEMALKMDQLELGPMLEVLGYKRNMEGTFATNIEVSGRGGSLAEMMAGLNGEIFMMVGDGQFAGKILARLEQVMGARVLKLINPFDQDPAKARVNCFTNFIRIKDGEAVCKLLLDTEQNSIFGAGKIDLKTEKLNFGIKPNPKKGYGHSKVGKVSVNLGELSKMMKLGGTLAEPSLAVDKMGTTLFAGKVFGGFLFGPFGLAAVAASEVFDFSRGDKNPCLAAIEEAKGAIQSADKVKKQTEAEKSDQKGKEPAAKESDSTVNKIGRKVKNLFKR